MAQRLRAALLPGPLGHSSTSWLRPREQAHAQLDWLLEEPCLDLPPVELMLEHCLLGILRQRVRALHEYGCMRACVHAYARTRVFVFVCMCMYVSIGVHGCAPIHAEQGSSLRRVSAHACLSHTMLMGQNIQVVSVFVIWGYVCGSQACANLLLTNIYPTC